MVMKEELGQPAKAMATRRRHASMCVVLFSLVAAYNHNTSFLSSISAANKGGNEIVPKKSTLNNGLHDNKVSSDHEELQIDSTSAIIRNNNVTHAAKEDEFLPENIGWPTRVPCGSQKCFYQLQSNPQVGYLVAPQTNSGRLSILQSGYQLAQQLESDYNVTHFLLGPPTEIRVSNELAKHLNRNLYIESKGRLRTGRHACRFPKGSMAVTQKVALAPKRHIILGCVKSKVRAFEHDIPKFLRHHVKYKQSFIQNFHESLKAAKRLLENEPCLMKDFQLMVDEKGRSYHLDIDR